MPTLSQQQIVGGPTSPIFIMNGSGQRGTDVAVVSGVTAAAGITTLIAAPAAGYRICVYTVLVQNESSTATTIELRDAVTRWRKLLQSQGDSLVLAFEHIQVWKLNEATALSLYLSGANSHNYNVQYSIDPVE